MGGVFLCTIGWRLLIWLLCTVTFVMAPLFLWPVSPPSSSRLRSRGDGWGSQNRAALPAKKRRRERPRAECMGAVSQWRRTFTSAYNQALLADIASFQKKLKDQISGWDLAAQYVFNKPVGQRSTHDFRMIGSGDLKKSQGAAWTVNAAASVYEPCPPARSMAG